jgi:hypothetical protein
MWPITAARTEIETMYGRDFTKGYRPALLGLAALLSAVVAHGASAGEPRGGAHRKDSETCTSFGASYGSAEYARCMLAQQRRRDNAPLNAAEQQRLSAEAARTNLETVRRMRCEREAKRDRQRGERPRWCH